jgi:NADPH2:quinone reductase
MKAIVVNQFGPPSVMQIAEVDKPEPTGDQVRIKVFGAGVNPIDYKTRKGLGFLAEFHKDKLPWIPGLDVSGLIDATGPDANDFKVGDRVFGRMSFDVPAGSYAEYTLCSQNDLAIAPHNLELFQASALPIASLTAYQALFKAGSLKEDDKILIHAAAGGVGHLAVQMARSVGAFVVCTASENNHKFLRSIGANKVIDYRKDDFTRNLPGKMDFILDSMGGDVGIQSLSVLAESGVMVTVPTITADQVISEGQTLGLNVKGIKVEVSREDLLTITDFIDKAKLKVCISNVLPLEGAVKAHKILETGHSKGKTILRI